MIGRRFYPKKLGKKNGKIAYIATSHFIWGISDYVAESMRILPQETHR